MIKVVPDSYPQYQYEIEVSATCDACQRFNSALGLTRRANRSLNEGSILEGAMAVKEGELMTISSWSPSPMLPVDVSFVPEAVAAYLIEAHNALSVGAHRAVLLLVRSLIEATARQSHISDGSLVQKINAMFEAGHLRKGTKDMAHALRILGNDMAHGEIEVAPNQEDAEDALTIARFVLDDVYVADARRADMMARRSSE